MAYEIKTIEKDEEYLRQISKDVDFENDNIDDYINALKDYCENNTVYALAPVQIGIPKRLIYIKNTNSDMNNNMLKDYNEGIVYINPVIIEEKGLTTFLEGCESCSFVENNKIVRYAAIVNRPYSIKFKYDDLNGNKNIKTIEGFEATVFCHEFDHLNGILHMDKSDKIYKMTLDEMKEFRLRNPYRIISKDCEYNS